MTNTPVRASFSPAAGDGTDVRQTDCITHLHSGGARIAFTVGTDQRGYVARVRIPAVELLRMASEVAAKMAEDLKPKET